MLFTGCSDCSVLVDDTKEEVLADKTVEIPASGYQSFDVTLSKSATISVELEVKEGSGVRFYTVDEAGYNAIKAGKSTFTYY